MNIRGMRTPRDIQNAGRHGLAGVTGGAVPVVLAGQAMVGPNWEQKGLFAAGAALFVTAAAIELLPAKAVRAAIVAAAAAAMCSAGAYLFLGAAHGASHHSRSGHAAFRVYRAPGYDLLVPRRWLAHPNPVPDDAYQETRVASPSGAIRALIDRTPNSTTAPETRASAMAAGSDDGRSGYARYLWDSTTVSGHPAWVWSFHVPDDDASQNIGSCPQKIDILFNASGDAYSVLACGSPFRSAERAAWRLARSIRPGSGATR
jgi:hypothetical protein